MNTVTCLASFVLVSTRAIHHLPLPGHPKVAFQFGPKVHRNFDTINVMNRALQGFGGIRLWRWILLPKHPYLQLKSRSYSDAMQNLGTEKNVKVTRLNSNRSKFGFRMISPFENDLHWAFSLPLRVSIQDHGVFTPISALSST